MPSRRFQSTLEDGDIEFEGGVAVREEMLILPIHGVPHPSAWEPHLKMLYLAIGATHRRAPRPEPR